MELTLKFNPFRPNGLIAPGVFHGRIPEIEKIEHCLFQTKNGNPVHFLIQGERGIGKSSLFYVVALTAQGTIEALDGTRLKFLVVSVDLGGAHTQIDIVRTIGRELKQVVAGHDAFSARAKSFLDWATNWEILGVRFHKQDVDFDPQDAADELISSISRLCAELRDDIDGLLILVDEADRPSEEANLGEFCKFFTERLMRKSCGSVVLGLAGLPSLIGKLRSSHESSPRIFTTMVLEPLEDDECRAVIRSGLEEANSKNAQETEIEPDALELLASLSEGYPHFIQQFSYSAFEADRDNIITVRDVVEGAFEENGALSQLGNKYFNEMYHSKISSDDYRTVLKTMAKYGDDWVSRKTIIKESGVVSTTVNNALNALKARGIIVADESRKGQGFYRLPTRSFAAWINAIQSIGERTGLEFAFESSVASNEGMA